MNLRCNPCSSLAAATLAVAVGSLLASCGHKPPTGEPTPPALGSDDRVVELMEKMRTRALNAPGKPVEAADFAYNVGQLYTQGVADRREISPKLVDEAVKCLDDARMSNPEKAADLLARKGEMLLAAGRQEPGVGALRGSMAERPNLRAFKPLIKHYETQKLTAEAETLCKRTLPALDTERNRYAVLEECLRVSGAKTPEAGLKWAGKKEINFYKRRKHEIDTLQAAAAKQAKAKEEAEKTKK
jgi:hypothetical protein